MSTPTTELPAPATDSPETIDAAPATPPAPPPSVPAPPVPPGGHTPGGLPALPLAVTTANTTIGGICAAVLAGGPALAAVTAAGALAATGAVVRTARRSRSGSRSGTLRAASASRGGSPRRARALSGSRSARRGTSRPAAAGSARVGGRRSAHRRNTATGGLSGRVAGVRAARTARASSAPTRTARRRADTAARRRLADARRAARRGGVAGRGRTAGMRGRGFGRSGQARRGALARGGAALAARRSRALNRRRSARDARLGDRIAARRLAVRRAPITRAARKRLAGSRRRYWTRRALAAALALPVGVLGMLTSPLGRRLGLAWLIHPGRRLHNRLTRTAREHRTARDEAIRAERETALTAEETERRVAESGPRPKPRPAPSGTKAGETMADTNGLWFNEAAAEMEAAAAAYHPDGAMHVLATIEGFPEALTSIANTFRILAEHCDTAFPVHQRVGEALNEVFRLLQQTIPAAEEVGKVFRTEHAADIARHEDPRTGEEMWDITNND